MLPSGLVQGSERVGNLLKPRPLLCPSSPACLPAAGAEPSPAPSFWAPCLTLFSGPPEVSSCTSDAVARLSGDDNYCVSPVA